ncbi:hypothetical protein M8J75_006662 [Diaphorina citri]|nr:hypothetical protein M8J75_006662 [Diaphorina citri]
MGGEKNKSEATMVKKIKVENWSSFLLQKLYHCYTQKKHCDFTLKMVDGTLKVHSVVMNACSNYFIQINLENSHSVTLPPELRKELMEPIVNFIYSGVLSFKANIQKDLVIASKILKIDILTKLIDTEDIMNDSKTFSHKTIPFEDAHIKERHFLSSGDTPTKFHSPSSHPGSSVIKSTGSSSLPSTPSTSGGVGKMAMKKLPFWKKRSTVPGASTSVSRPEDSEDVKPSRFELPEDACPNSSYFYIPDFDNPLSYESECIILKRVTQSAEAVTDSKKIKLIKSVVAHEDDMSGDEILPDDDYDDFDEYPPPIPSSATSVPTTPKPILKTDKFDSARKKSVRFSTPGDPSDESPNTTGEPPPSKPDPEETIITRKIVTIKEEQVDPPPLVISDPQQRVVVAPSSSGQGSNNIHLSLNNPTELASIDPNHAKIIEEVLQKYPDLIHGNRNFKLKVVNSDNQIINYIMNNRNKCLTSGKKRSRKSLGPATVPGMMNNGPSSGAPPRGASEQTTAHPFECKFCASSLAEPLPDYYTWRKHMEDVHSEKFDVRICEYCGLKLSKRNLYLYHLLRVHGIQNETMKFPECKFCNYIALTENLLYKHCKNVHNKLIGFVCSTCNIIFKTHDQLTAHMKHTEHGAEKKTHGCKYCGKQFDRSVNLKAHLRANHKSEADAETDLGGSVVVKEEPSSGQEVYEYVNQSQQYIEVPLVQNSGYGTLVLPGGVTIIDTNNARLAGDSSLGAGESLVPGQRGMQGHSGESLAPREAMHAQEAQGQVSLGGSEGLAPRDGGMQGQAMMAGAESLVPGEGMEAQGMIAGADGMMGDGSGLTGEATIEHNEAVLGTNECGQTVLILNGTQQYILEQQSDGRLILPDILANNCVISYAEETAPGGLEQSGEYEIINVDQTQEVLMAGHARILVSQVEHAPSTRRGVETLYGSHEGETILDSQESSNQLVLGSRRYDGTILTSGEPNGHTTHHSMSEHSMSGHAMEQPVMQAILTSTGKNIIDDHSMSGHAMEQSVMQAILTSTGKNIIVCRSIECLLGI